MMATDKGYVEIANLLLKYPNIDVNTQNNVSENIYCASPLRLKIPSLSNEVVATGLIRL